MNCLGIRLGILPFTLAAMFAIHSVEPLSGQTQPPTTESAEKVKAPFDAKTADKEIRDITNKINQLQKDLKDKSKATPDKPGLVAPPQRPLMPPEPQKPAANANKATMDKYNQDYQQWQQQVTQFKQDDRQFPKKLEQYYALAKLYPDALKKWQDTEKQRLDGINQEVKDLLKRRKEIEDAKKEAKKAEKATTDK